MTFVVLAIDREENELMFEKQRPCFIIMYLFKLEINLKILHERSFVEERINYQQLQDC